MKNSELIQKLQILLTKHGDTEMHFSVVDYYNHMGSGARMSLIVGDTPGMPSYWFGSFTHDGHTTVNLYLDSSPEGKRAKISFIK